MGNVFQTEVDMAKAKIVAALVLCNIAMKQNMPMSEGTPGDGYSGANVGQPGDPEDRVLEGPINLQRNWGSKCRMESCKELILGLLLFYKSLAPSVGSYFFIVKFILDMIV